MLDSSTTSDNVVAQVKATDGSVRLLDEANTASSYRAPADSAQTTQQMVDAGQVPSLEIVSPAKNQSFNRWP
jgi:hypothetical protein